jgi:hypothetical protein
MAMGGGENAPLSSDFEKYAAKFLQLKKEQDDNV